MTNHKSPVTELYSCNRSVHYKNRKTNIRVYAKAEASFQEEVVVCPKLVKKLDSFCAAVSLRMLGEVA